MEKERSDRWTLSGISFGCSKHGRRSKFKWPDTFLIESSGRRETPESIAEAKAREARKQNATIARQHATPEEEDENAGDPDAEHDPEHRFLENDTGSDQDISEDEDLDDSIIDDSSNDTLISIWFYSTRNPIESRQFV